MKPMQKVIVVSLVALGCVGWWKFLDLRMRAALAEEQIRYFSEVVEQAAADPGTNIQLYVEGINNYYPSGSKQKAGSQLDAIVERCRTKAMEEIKNKKSGVEARAKSN